MTLKPTKVQGVNGIMHLIPKQAQEQGVNGTMDLIPRTGCKSHHGFGPTTDKSTGVNRTMNLTPQQTQVQA